VISNCSNNYGPGQYPEKLIPLFINNIINNQSIPIYGDGKNIRDWLYVKDHVLAINLIFHKSKIGETYNIGGNNEMTNNEIAQILIRKLDSRLGRLQGKSRDLIRFVNDRLGHDKRYAIDYSKIKKELGWNPKHTFEIGIDKTIDWYLNNLN
jgi:dTDP-glucose 4,6-dehydratase